MELRLLKIPGDQDEGCQQLDKFLQRSMYDVVVNGNPIPVSSVTIVSVQFTGQETLCWYIDHGQSQAHLKLREVFAQF